MAARRAARVLSATLLLVGMPVAGVAQEAPTGPRLRVGAQEITFDGRVQTQFNTTSAGEAADFEILLRRVYLGATVRVNDLISGKIQADFAGNRVVLRDTYILLTFSPGFELLAGNAYRPFSLLASTSDVRILPIERGARIRGVTAVEEQNLVSELGYAERDIGFQVRGAPRGAPLGFSYAAGFFRGPTVEAAPADSPYQLGARAAVRPLPDLGIGAAWSGRSFARTGGGLQQGNAYEVDLEIGRFAPGLHFMGELAWGDYAPDEALRFRGAQGWLAYRTPELTGHVTAVEPVLRFSRGDLDDPLRDLGGSLITPGINLYFGGWNRLMLNYDVWVPRGDGDTEGSFRAQLGLSF